MNLRLEYGEGYKSVEIDEGRFLGLLGPKPVDEVADVGKAVEDSLKDPIGSEPLGRLLRGKKDALILTVDATRPSPRPLLTPILSLCERLGVKATICIAIGRHRSMTREELRHHLGEEIYDNWEVVQHDPFDDGIHIEVGHTRRGTPIKVNEIVFQKEVVLGVGTIEPSYLCGFSGGRKLIMPGISHHTAIDANHYLLIERGAEIGKLEGNPVSEDAEEFARKVPFHWITCSVVGPEDEIVDVVSGDPYLAHEKGCELSRRIFRCERREAEIVIASPGGFPYDCDLVQGKKAVIPAAEMVKRGGVIIILSECREGFGAEDAFRDWITRLSPREVVRRVKDRSHFSLGAHGANILAKPIVEKGVKVVLVTEPQMASQLSSSYLVATTDLEDALGIAEEHTSSHATVLALRKARRLIPQKVSERGTFWGYIVH